jgi:hypothetical protein
MSATAYRTNAGAAEVSVKVGAGWVAGAATIGEGGGERGGAGGVGDATSAGCVLGCAPKVG